MSSPPSNNQPIGENLARWQHYLSGIPSPEIWIRFGYYYLIGAALQRRVWEGHELKALFPNTYVVFVGRPGTGKGEVTTPIAEMLNYWKVDEKGRTCVPLLSAASAIDKNTQEAKPLTMTVEEVDNAAKLAIELINSRTGRHIVGSGNKLSALVARDASSGDKEPKLLFPTAPDTSTFEGIVNQIAKCTTACRWFSHSPPIYIHSSLNFVLDELASLFRKHAEDVVRFLQQGYGCGDYTYHTKDETKRDYIKRMCINFIAGTQPDFMEHILDSQLLSEGLSSRAWFIYASKNRFNNIFPGYFSDEQLACREYLLQHIRKLSTVVGQCRFEPAAEDYLRQWWNSDMFDGQAKINQSPKLEHYYARKGIHAKKLAIILHFSELQDITEHGMCDMVIKLPTVIAALDELELIERSMHLALQFRGANPLAAVSKRILTFIRNAQDIGCTKRQLMEEFFDDLPELDVSLDAILNHWQDQQKIDKWVVDNTEVYKLTKLKAD